MLYCHPFQFLMEQLKAPLGIPHPQELSLSQPEIRECGWGPWEMWVEWLTLRSFGGVSSGAWDEWTLTSLSLSSSQHRN